MLRQLFYPMHLPPLLVRSVPLLCAFAAALVAPAQAASPMISDFTSQAGATPESEREWLSSGSAVTRQPFGEIKGQPVELFVLTNSSGVWVKIISYGARVAALRTPDRNGKPDDIVLGCDTLEGYLSPKEPYFGAIVGRVGNRIAKGKFTLDGKDYQLATNNAPNHLHGGSVGFDRVRIGKLTCPARQCG
jgi:aldose 1-epimerase